MIADSDSDLNITWMANANLFKTQAASDPNMVDHILNSVGGVVHDLPNSYDKPVPNSGIYSLSTADFNPVAGTINWWGAKAYLTYLNNINYAGASDWRLPNVQPVKGNSFYYTVAYDGSTDLGYNITSTQSELGYMFHTELVNKGFYNTASIAQSGYGLLNTRPFTNLTAVIIGTTQSMLPT